MRIKISNFLASFPRINATKLKDTAAQEAVNVDVSNGVIEPLYSLNYHSKLAVMGNPIKDFKVFEFPDKSGFFQFVDHIDLAYSPIADDQYRRIYWSGDSRDGKGNLLFSYTPLLTNGIEYNPLYWYRVGVPAPKLPLNIISHTTEYTAEEQEELSDEARLYVYTYVTEIGEESAPSPASAVTIIPHDKSTVTLQIPDVDVIASESRLITKKRIYRSLTNSNGTADLYYLADILSSESTYIDKLDGESLNTNDPLATTGWDEPRENLQGLNVTANGMNYAFTGKIACFSKPYYPYVWSRDYELTMNYDIVAMGHYENYVICATKGTPYLVSVIDPSTSSIQELPLNEACIAKRSMVSMATCALYASPNGIVMAYGSTAKLVSESFFDKNTWNKLNPSSIHAIEHRGKYLFFYDAGNENKGAYMFDPRQVDLGIVKLDFWYKAATRLQNSDLLYFLNDNNEIYKFNDVADVKKPYLWLSKKFDVEGDGARFLAAKVIADDYQDLTFKVYSDGNLFYTKKVTNRKPFRMPNHSNRYQWQIEISGTSKTQMIEIAESMLELSK